jgi:hypothetical protein
VRPIDSGLSESSELDASAVGSGLYSSKLTS